MKHVIGDLIKVAQQGEVDIIAHQCNCFCNMGKGIAPQIKQAFPQAYEADLATVKGDRTKLGTFSRGIYPRSIIEGTVTVYNLYGQYDYRGGNRNTDYTALKQSLEAMREQLLSDGLYGVSIGIPLLGCGLGGGDWNVVSQIVDDVLEGFDVILYTLG